jgi:hypothetical protein
MVVDPAMNVPTANVSLLGSGWSGAVTVEVRGPAGKEDDRLFPRFTEHDAPGLGLLAEGAYRLTVRDDYGCVESIDLTTQRQAD